MIKIKERSNPSAEFKNDPMMRELHEIRQKNYQATKDMSKEELIKYIREKAKRFRKSK